MVVQDLNGGYRHLGGVEPGPDVAPEAVEHRLDVDVADALQRARKESVDGQKSPVALTWMCRSRYSGPKCSSAWICSLLSLIFRVRTVSSSLRSRWWRVCRSLRIHPPPAPRPN